MKFLAYIGEAILTIFGGPVGVVVAIVLFVFDVI
jgi:hypothetical protein